MDRNGEQPSRDSATGCDDLIRGLERELSGVSAMHRGVSFELYHRAAWTLRASVEPSISEVPQLTTGEDHGLAIRCRARGESKSRFAAVSGHDESACRRALNLASGSPGLGSGGCPFPDRSPAHDRDVEARPSTEEVREWLGQGTRSVEASGVTLGEAWVEVAETIESWVSTSGLRASRRRVRAWGMAQIEGRRSAPVWVASRGWGGLDPNGWTPEPSLRQSDSLWVFRPEAAATLVSALIRTLHLDPRHVGSPVGPGWQVADEPTSSGALWGGTFDDVGTPSSSTTLADGCKIVSCLDGEGHCRRASYRDPPARLSACPTVVSQGKLPASATEVLGLNVHPLDGAWMLELQLAEGRRYARAHPLDLVRRCEAAAGPVKLSHRGVITPSLVFDKLPLIE